jgi:putative Holliday junction resolvase
MGIDFGEKRIGIAVSDELNMCAHPVGTVQNDKRTELNKISGLVKEYCVNKIVIGLPVQMDDNLGESATKVQQFADRLKKYVPAGVSIVFQDERLTTKEIEAELIELGVTRKKRKQKIDELSARLILEHYMNSFK